MSESDRGPGFKGPIFLVIVLAIGSLILFQKSGYQHVVAVSNVYDASEYKERADQRIADECASLDGIAVFECQSDIIQSTRDAHRAQKDLKAQRYMALWAFVMAASAVVGVAVTILGVVYIKDTLDQSRDANKAAHKAIDATREIGLMQLRPWVIAETVGFQFFSGLVVNGSAPSPGVVIWIDWVITGQSPATSVAMHSKFEIIDRKGAVPEFESRHKLGQKTAGIGVPVHSEKVGINGENFLRIFDGKAIVILHGACNYNGPFSSKEHWRTEATYQIQGNGKISENGYEWPNLEFHVVGPQNSAT